LVFVFNFTSKTTGATSGARIAYSSGAPEWLCICVLGVLILALFLRF
jgi:hypothetical protein